MKRNIWKYWFEKKKKRKKKKLVYFRERAAVTGRGEGEINARSVTEKDRGVTYGRALFFQKVVKFYRCRCGIKRSKVSETQLDVAANHVNERRAPIIFLRLSARGPLLPVRDNAARNVANIPNARRGTHTHIRAHTLPHHQHHHQHKHDEFYSRTIAYTKTRKRGRATILETLVFNIRRSFEVLVSSRYFAQTRPRCTYVYIYFEFTFDSMNYCDIPTNCRPLIYSSPPPR